MSFHLARYLWFSLSFFFFFATCSTQDNYTTSISQPTSDGPALGIIPSGQGNCLQLNFRQGCYTHISCSVYCNRFWSSVVLFSLTSGCSHGLGSHTCLQVRVSATFHLALTASLTAVLTPHSLTQTGTPSTSRLPLRQRVSSCQLHMFCTSLHSHLTISHLGMFNMGVSIRMPTIEGKCYCLACIDCFSYGGID